MSEKVQVNLSNSTILRTIGFLIALVALFALRDLLLVILTSVVLASAVEPFAKWLMDHRFPRLIAVITVYAGLFIVLTGVFYFIVPAFVDEVTKVATTLPKKIASVPELKSLLSGPLALSQWREIVAGSFSVDGVLSTVGSAIGDFGGSVSQTARGIFGGITSFFLTVVISFYLAVQENGIDNVLRLVLPQSLEDYGIDLWRRSKHKIGLWIQGQVMLGLVIGVFVYLGLTVFGVPYAFLLAMLAALFELIPIFGPVLAAVPAIFLAFSQGTTIGFAVIAFYVIIQQFENHLIYPLVVRKIIGVPPLIVIIALIVGLQLGGFMGVLLAVPLASAGMEFIEDIEKKKRFARLAAGGDKK